MHSSNLPTTSSARAPHFPRRRRRHWGRRFLIAMLFFGGFLLALRMVLPSLVRGYVNRTLDSSQLYHGKIGRIDIELLRGAYSIYDVRLIKMTGDVPVPLFSGERVDLAIEWNALLHRRVVGQVVLYQPQLNFVDAPNAANAQTGQGGPWLQIIQDLFPFKINSVRIHNGSIHFRSYRSTHPVDVYLSQLEASVDDLTNIRDSNAPLITTLDAHALAMDQAEFECHMKLNPFSYRPSFHMAVRLLGLDVTKINDLALTYGQFDFKGGWFDLVIAADARAGTMSGYVKPLFRNLRVFSLPEDLHDNPLQFFWQAVIGVTQQVLKNQPRDQFGTFIPFTGDATNTQPDLLATIGNVLRNGFVRAYLPKLEQGTASDEAMQFEPPAVSDPITAGDSEP